MSRTSQRPSHALSDLSVTEFLTLGRMGFLPHGLVVGVSVYDAGFMSTPLGYTAEVTSIGNAMRAARTQAVRRMVHQAATLNAEGVVGVRIDVEHHVWHGGHTVAKFEAVGTAIRFDPRRAPREFANAPSLKLSGGPFTSALSGQDFVILLRTGYRPISVGAGSCVYEVSKTALQQVSGWTSPNVEIAEYTQAFMDAREAAMQRLQTDLFAEHAQGTADAPVGIVGMTVEEKLYPGVLPMIEYTAIGTAIAPLRADDPRRGAQLPAPVMVVPLDR